MKILQLLYDDLGNPWLNGGGPIAVRIIADYMAAHGHSTMLVCGNHPNVRMDKTQNSKIEITRIGTGTWGYFISRVTYALSAFYYLLRNINKYDIVVDNTSPFSPTFSFLFSGKKPVVANVTALFREMTFRKNLAYALPSFFFEKIILSSYCYYTTISPLTKEYIPKSKKCFIVPVGIDLEEIPLADNVLKENYIAFLGRLEMFGKGIDILINSIEQIKEYCREHGLKCKIAGTGKDMAKLKRMITQKKIEDICQCIGRIDGGEKYEFLQKAMLLVFPTRFELFGRVAIEAQVCGTPVIGSDIPALKFAVSDGNSGTLLPPERFDLFASEMLSFLKDSEKRERYSHSAINYGRQFDRRIFLKRRLDAYNEIIADHLRRKNRI